MTMKNAGNLAELVEPETMSEDEANSRELDPKAKHEAVAFSISFAKRPETLIPALQGTVRL